MAGAPPDPYSRTLRVLNLGSGTDDKLLSRGLQRFGPVSWARVVIVYDEAGRECPLGFVQFRDASGYQRALDYRDPIIVDHHEVRIRPARPPGRSRDVAVVGQIPVGTTAEEIEAAFADYNPIHLRVVAPDGQRPFAFVRPATEADQARLLVDARDGIEVGGETVVVRFARPLAVFPRMAQKRVPGRPRDVSPTWPPLVNGA
jgi:RNA recognition motif-containing protein